MEAVAGRMGAVAIPSLRSISKQNDQIASIDGIRFVLAAPGWSLQ
jgi:hypothetical protein